MPERRESDENKKGPLTRPLKEVGVSYRVDSISNPQASNRGSGMYLEFLFFRAHSRKRVERMYWSGWSLNSLTTCSNSVMVGTTGPIGSGLPQLGLPRRFAIVQFSFYLRNVIRMTHLVAATSCGRLYLIGFTMLLQRFRAPFQVRSQGPHTREGTSKCSNETVQYTPVFPQVQVKIGDFLDRFPNRC